MFEFRVRFLLRRICSFFVFIGEVIKVWDIVVVIMKVGEVCYIICKFVYAYGSVGSFLKIFFNVTFVFEVSV